MRFLFSKSSLDFSVSITYFNQPPKSIISYPFVDNCILLNWSVNINDSEIILSNKATDFSSLKILLSVFFNSNGRISKPTFNKFKLKSISSLTFIFSVFRFFKLRHNLHRPDDARLITFKIR
ncbi:hypothetical protein D3C72_738650 [compost metagenome]